MLYLFGDCEKLEPQRFELRHHGQVRPIEPQVFDVLVLLIQAATSWWSPSKKLWDTAWGYCFVGDSALTSRIKSLRQAVGDDGTTLEGIVRTCRDREPDQLRGRRHRARRPIHHAPPGGQCLAGTLAFGHCRILDRWGAVPPGREAMLPFFADMFGGASNVG